MMKFTPTDLPGVMVIEPQLFGDSRGFFMETFQAREFAAAGLPTDFAQDNHSGSGRGILRGLHYQIRQPQGKLVRAVSGALYDVAVDLRRSSPHFGRWYGIELSAENKKMLWIPPGFAHGFYVLTEWAELLYKATDFYAPEWDRSIRWDDPDLAIRWPLPPGEAPRLSAKDAAALPFHQADCYD